MVSVKMRGLMLCQKSFFWLFIVLSFVSLFVPKIVSVNLSKFDPDKHRVAVYLNNNPLFTRGNVDFFVSFNPITLMISDAFTMPSVYPRSVFLLPSILKSEYFDVIVAHELGHLEFSHSRKTTGLEQAQMEADNFAAELLGRNRVLKFRRSIFSEDNYLVQNLKQASAQ
jgi:hypothetical protein